MTTYKGFEVGKTSNLGLLMECAKRVPADDEEIVTCSDCGRRVPYGYIANLYVEPVHDSSLGLAADWCTRLVCREYDHAPTPEGDSDSQRG